MKVGIYGQSNNEVTLEYVHILANLCRQYQIEAIFEENLYSGFNRAQQYDGFETFSDYYDLDASVDFFFTVGGDGTFLRSITFIRDHKIPIIGINTGRLGFLATIQKEKIKSAFLQIVNGQFSLRKRSLLSIKTDLNEEPFQGINFALNEIAVTRKNTASMIKVDTVLDGEFLTAYWSDGLIISTPTGSTGYSMSCGGPIISPSSKNIALTPIAPHSLSVRPLVIPDKTAIELFIDSRADDVLLTLDSRMYTISNKTRIYISKCKFPIKTVELNEQTFIKTLREKLLWGEDKRN